MNFNIKEAEMGNVFLYYYLPCCILCHGVWYILSLTRYVIESRAARNISSTILIGMKRIYLNFYAWQNVLVVGAVVVIGVPTNGRKKLWAVFPHLQI